MALQILTFLETLADRPDPKGRGVDPRRAMLMDQFCFRKIENTTHDLDAAINRTRTLPVLSPLLDPRLKRSEVNPLQRHGTKAWNEQARIFVPIIFDLQHQHACDGLTGRSNRKARTMHWRSR